jgi:hypothetical protein
VELDLIVKAKTITWQAAAVARAVLDTLLKMTNNKVCCVTVVQE